MEIKKLKCSDGWLDDIEVKEVEFVSKGLKEGWGHLRYWGVFGGRAFFWRESECITPIKLVTSEDPKNCQLMEHVEENHWFPLSLRTELYLRENITNLI